MKQEPLTSSEQIKLMHTPKPRTCAYSDERIEKSEIAITISPSNSNDTNEWLKLASINPLVDEIQSLDLESDGEVEFGSGRMEYVQGAISNYLSEPHGRCAICEEHNLDDSSNPKSTDILTFTFKVDRDPWVHGCCIEELASELEKVFTIESEKQTEIMTQIV